MAAQWCAIVSLRIVGQFQGNAFTGSGKLTLESDTGGGAILTVLTKRILLRTDVEFSLAHDTSHSRSVEAELKKLVNAEIKAWKDELILK